LLKLNAKIKNHRLKFLALWFLHTFKRRYFAVNFDPVLACNYRCKMCYFTDKDYVKKLKGSFDKNDLDLWAKNSLPRALKLQVGCGAEPTVYKHLDRVFELGKQYKVPHISLTTNAYLLNRNDLIKWIENGLQEITVSMHGVYKETYEYFMGNGDYQRFHESLQLISILKKDFPELVLRINYTFNEDNFKELSDFFKLYAKYDIDIIQLRPVSKIGNTAYQNFSLDKIIPVYDEFMQQFKKQAQEYKTDLLAPASGENLIDRKNDSSIIFDYTYFYVSPTHFWKKDFDWKKESFESYAKKIHWGRQLFSNIFKSKKHLKYLQKEQNLNYDIEING
jgi:MoaA/NifB/PqqE/SkfB family radical SAM enzyme